MGHRLHQDAQRPAASSASARRRRIRTRTVGEPEQRDHLALLDDVVGVGTREAGALQQVCDFCLPAAFSPLHHAPRKGCMPKYFTSTLVSKAELGSPQPSEDSRDVLLVQRELVLFEADGAPQPHLIPLHLREFMLKTLRTCARLLPAACKVLTSMHSRMPAHPRGSPAADCPSCRKQPPHMPT